MFYLSSTPVMEASKESGVRTLMPTSLHSPTQKAAILSLLHSHSCTEVLFLLVHHRTSQCTEIGEPTYYSKESWFLLQVSRAGLKKRKKKM